MKFNTFLLLLTLSGVIPGSITQEYVFYSDVQMEYKFHRNPLKWYDAKIKCASENAELAMPKDEAEATVIKKIFEGYPRSMLPGVVRPDWVLLGFHDSFRESEFVTLSGDSIQNYYHTWSPGEPDNHQNEDCGSMHRNGKLNDFPCWAEGLFICEKRGENAKKSISNENCPTSDAAYQYAPGINKCYKLHMNQRTWPDARIICSLEGGHLAIIRNKAEEKFLEKLFNDPANKVNYAAHKDYALIGFHDAFQENYFTTVLDENLHDVGYVNWAPGQPDNDHGRTENCGSIYKTGALNDISCDKAAVFICELFPNFDFRFAKNN